MISLQPEEDKKLRQLLTKINEESKAKITLLIDKSGQLISRSESPAFSSDDITFASLTAGNVAASEALSKLLGDENINHMFTETESEGIYMVLINNSYILVSIFNKAISNLGIVRLKFRKYYNELTNLLKEIERRVKEEKSVAENIDIEDIDLDTLFE
ncbi:MAG: dynein regulation protein LC7 [Thermovibrio sp.]|nr:MAG: dynein regulation protein LC7 [Thermovibrio sp.]